MTTTPQRDPLLVELVDARATAVTRAPTLGEPRATWRRAFSRPCWRRYGGTRQGRQELDGEFVLDAEGALWSWEMLRRRGPRRLPGPTASWWRSIRR